MRLCKLAASFFILVSLHCIPAFSEGNNSSESLVAGVEAIEGPLEYVVCSNGVLNVRNEQLNKVLFTVVKGDRALPVQSFGTDTVKKVMDGKTFYFIKLQFPERNSELNIGWVAKSYLALKSQCPGTGTLSPQPVTATTAAWGFPTIKRPVQSYVSGMRKFRASRSGGRLHAAADLYRTLNEPILAVNAGTIIRDRYYFYQGTYAMEVVHSDGRIMRYGEITGKRPPNAGVNKAVKPHQIIGYMGKVNSGCCTPMLHFEMYSGTAKGSLTQSGNAFSRRKDLMDPTRFLQSWENQMFGVSF